MGRPRTLGPCAVIGCGWRAVAKDLCGLHYSRARKGLPLDGPLRKKASSEPCSVAKCRGKARALGMCPFHYARKREGVPLDAPKQRHRERPAGAAAPGECACSVMDCGRKVAAMGMCWGHYRRQLRGAPLGVSLHLPDGGKYARVVREGPKNAPAHVRRRALFEWYLREGLVTPEPNTGCLLWLGRYNPVTGYPLLGHNQNSRQRAPWGATAHRAALYFSGVELERGNRKRHSRHLCNNPGCVAAEFNAPVAAHVVYGTAKENMADRTARYRRGELNPPTPQFGPRKMGPALIAYAWAAHDAGVTVAELARDLGLCWQTVDKAIRSVAVHHQNPAQAA